MGALEKLEKEEIDVIYEYIKNATCQDGIFLS
jgi:hypothetical protein